MALYGIPIYTRRVGGRGRGEGGKLGLHDTKRLNSLQTVHNIKWINTNTNKPDMYSMNECKDKYPPVKKR